MSFQPLPGGESIVLAWPTPNRHLFTAPEKFFARTRVNPDYGKPGFTRDCGRRFHRGCDIAPVFLTATGKSTRVTFTDCATGRDFDSDEPTFIPHDEVCCVFPGKIIEAVRDESASDFGRHVVVEHHWPASSEKFFTLYGHLAEVTGTLPVLGRMGQTSRIADARNWMAIAPHLHFEVLDAAGRAYDPLAFLSRYLPR